MPQPWMGIFLLVALLVTALSLWRAIQQKTVKKGFYWVIGLTVLLRVFSAQNPELHQWDERYHALVAKHMVKAPLEPILVKNQLMSYSNQDWVGGKVWLAKPAVPLWMMSTSIYFFGNHALSVRIPSILLSALGAWLIFLFGKRMFDEKTGLLAAFLWAIHGLLIELAGGNVSSDHVEMSFVFFVLLGIYLLYTFYLEGKKSWYVFFVGVAMGLAFLSKWYPAFLIYPLWFCISLSFLGFQWKRLFQEFGLLTLGAGLIIFPWTYYIWIQYPEELSAVLGQVFSALQDSVAGHEQPFYYYGQKFLVLYGVGSLFALYFFIKRYITGEGERHWLGLILWILIPLILFSFGQTKRFTYLLLFAPAVFLMTSHYWWMLKDRLVLGERRVLAVLLLMVLLAFPVQYSIERLKPFESYEQSKSGFYALTEEEKEQLNDTAIVLGTDDYIEILFHTEAYAAQRQMLDLEKRTAWEAKGFIFYIIEEGKLKRLSGE